MAIAATMSHDENNKGEEDQHEHDMVMPGFRFHPTEEELIEFYLRRKVEGKRFNVELITFLDLYRYDPWELPALAAIGEKEWFFYVPRDRKYRNGDRPNRVTTSGYWKATGADRMIRTENFRSIGLKKTLVFYSGKAPKGIRTSWIMNEYRLPHQDTERLQKAEISLCRVYKRAGVEDHPSLPRSLPTTRASSSRTTQSAAAPKKSSELTNHPSHIEGRFQAYVGHHHHQEQLQEDKQLQSETSGSSSTDVGTISLQALSNKHNTNYISLAPMAATTNTLAVADQDDRILLMPPHSSSSNKHSCPAATLGPGDCSTSSVIFPAVGPSFLASNSSSSSVDDLHRLVNYQAAAAATSIMNHHQQQQQYHNINIPNHPSQLISTLHAAPLPPQSSSSTIALNMLPGAGSLQAAFTHQDRLIWDWNTMSEASKDYNNNPFK